MKAITIRLPNVETAMLVEVQEVNRVYRVLQSIVLSQTKQEYLKFSNGRVSRQRVGA